MKTLVILVILLVAVIASPVMGNFFFTERADVLQKEEFLLKEGAFFSRFIDVWEPKLYEENPPVLLQGTLSRKEILEFPFELNAGLSDNLTVGFSTSYIWNLQDLNISGNPYILSTSGLAYVGISGKYRIIKEESGIPGFSMLVKAKFPLGDEDLSGEDRGFKLKLPLGLRGISLGIYELVSKKMNPWAVHFNFGYEYCAPYDQKSDSLGGSLAQPRTIDPGDRLLYNFACEREWEKFSLVIELNGILTRDLKINDISIRDSGMHTLDGIISICYFPSPAPADNFSVDIGIRTTILSSGRNQKKNFGPTVNLNQRF